MEFIQLIVDTLLLYPLMLIILGIIIWINTCQLGKVSPQQGTVLQLRVFRLFSLLLMPILSISILVHGLYFVIFNLTSQRLPGLRFDSVSGIIGIFFALIFFIITFMSSVPTLTGFYQFLKLELGRTIIVFEEQRSLEIHNKRGIVSIRNTELSELEFNIKRSFVRGDEPINFIKLISKDGNHVIITDLRTDVTGFTPLQDIYKGIKRTYRQRFFNTLP